MLPTKRINELAFRFNGQYFYGEEVNTYLINLKDQIVLFDIPTYSREIEEYLNSFKKPLIALLSHGSCGIADGSIWQDKVGLKVYLQKKDKSSEWLKMKPDILFSEPPWISDSLEVILTPGHTPGSICLYEKTAKTIFTGDTFGGEKNGEVYDFFKKDGFGDLNKRFNSCKRLMDYDFKRVLPFHYEMILENAKDSLEAFIKKHS